MRYPFTVIMAAALLVMPYAAKAAETANPLCADIQTAIMPLKPPTFEGSANWKKTLGLAGYESFVKILKPEKRNDFVAIGMAKPLNAAPQIMLTVFDENGRMASDKRFNIKGLKKVVGALAAKSALYILSEVEAKGRVSVRLDIVDANTNKITGQKIIRSETADLVVRDGVSDGASLYIAAQSVPAKVSATPATVFYKLDLKGNLIWRKEYLPGVETRIERLALKTDAITKNTQIYGAGRMKSGGRDIGWLMVVDTKGNVSWQQNYSRGMASILRGLDVAADGSIIAAGESIPSDGAARAAWVMKVKADGSQVWERFVTGTYNYGAENVHIYPDNRISVLSNGDVIKGVNDGVEKGAGRQHARILMFSPLGAMLADQGLIEASNAKAEDIYMLENMRIVAGRAQTGFPAANMTEQQVEATYDAWLTGITKAPKQADPCVAKEVEKFDE